MGIAALALNAGAGDEMGLGSHASGGEVIVSCSDQIGVVVVHIFAVKPGADGVEFNGEALGLHKGVQFGKLCRRLVVASLFHGIGPEPVRGVVFHGAPLFPAP